MEDSLLDSGHIEGHELSQEDLESHKKIAVAIPDLNLSVGSNGRFKAMGPVN